MEFVNANGTVFHSKKQMKGKVYRKNVKYWVGRFSGFGMQKDVFDEVVEQQKQGIIFVLKNDLIDFYESRRKNRDVIACTKGEYFISLDDMLKFGEVATLRERDGEQIFISEFRCTKLS